MAKKQTEKKEASSESLEAGAKSEPIQSLTSETVTPENKPDEPTEVKEQTPAVNPDEAPEETPEENPEKTPEKNKLPKDLDATFAAYPKIAKAYVCEDGHFFFDKSRALKRSPDGFDVIPNPYYAK